MFKELCDKYPNDNARLRDTAGEFEVKVLDKAVAPTPSEESVEQVVIHAPETPKSTILDRIEGLGAKIDEFTVDKASKAAGKAVNVASKLKGALTLRFSPPPSPTSFKDEPTSPSSNPNTPKPSASSPKKGG